MTKGSRYIHRTKYNILFILTTLMACVTGYVLLDVAAERVLAAQEPVWPIDRDAVVIEIEKPVEVPVDRYVNCETEKCEILAYIVEKFQDDVDDAITIVNKCENSTFDQSRTNHNRNGTIDYGVFQINDIHTARYGEAFKTDWKANVDVAYQIFQDRGWTAWSCSSVVGVRSFWQ